MTLTTKKLGFAAYMRMKKCRLLSKDADGFHFDISGTTREELELEYANSESALFNSALIELSQFNKERH
jgi:hypothetical protein